MLEIKNLSYSVTEDGHKINILKNVNLKINDNRLVVITGPNGGGKTTLAKAIMGLIRPTSGSVIFNGRDITDMSITDRAKLGIGYGFQHPPRFKGLKVKDLLSMAGGREFSCDEHCGYLTRVGLCAMDYVERDVDSSLSGGEVKRIEIATVLARGSEFMIFDEPEAGIDLWSFSRLIETFKTIHEKDNATILIISHQERILKMADEIILISGGEIIETGSSEKVLPNIMDGILTGCKVLENI